VLVAAVAVFFSLASQRSATLAQGTDAPALSLATLDGSPFDLTSLRGRPVVLNCFATWGPPCRAEMGEFQSFQAAHPEVSVVGVAIDSGNPAQVRAFTARHGVTFKVALADETAAARYGVNQLPTTYVVQPDGRLGRSFIGPITEGILVRATAGLATPAPPRRAPPTTPTAAATACATRPARPRRRRARPAGGCAPCRSPRRRR
jgi:peroxiredoxin